MANRPSEPLLVFLRDAIRKKGLTTAQLAETLKVDRATLKHRLSGSEPLTVDDFVLLTQALELTPEQLGLPASAETVPFPPETADTPAASDAVGGDPLGNIPKQVLQLGFTLGVDIFLMLDAAQCKDSGVPPAVLGRFPDALPIKLEARWHAHNRPKFLDDGFECVLFFDRLYTVSFPWTSFRQVSFGIPADTPQPLELPEPPKGPHLRLVK